MSFPPRAIPLKCVNCGAKLEITPDMDRFACGYCGTEQLVERKGGTIALKGVEEAISRVQVGTDKTAAELALPRLEKELEEVTKQRKLIEARANSGGVGIGCLSAIVVFVIAAYVIGSVKSTDVYGNDKTSGGLAALALIISIVVGVIVGSTTGKTNKEQYASSLDRLRARENDLYSKIAKNKGIADS
jgi:DNA-directed RNA polymerase subunit RPC12/RpoP